MGLRSAGKSLTHGTRAYYQTHHCRCLRCRAAEATYRQQLRTRKAKKLPILGHYISASEAWARIRTLKSEKLAHRQITGWKNHRRLPLGTRDEHGVYHLPPESRVRLKTLLRLRKLCDYHLIDDDELPNHTREAS